MNDRKDQVSRRKFLAQATALTLSTGVTATGSPGAAAHSSTSLTRPLSMTRDGRKPIAMVATVFRPMSHAEHFTSRFIYGYPRNGVQHVPAHHIAAMHVDQFPSNDLARSVCRRQGIRLAESIDAALTGGGDTLQVDGVLLIGEHGNYPRNAFGQILYPRFEMMEQIAATFQRTGQVVPVFIDKALSYSAAKARQIYDCAQELRIPLLAGSSLPTVWRRPELELPLDVALDEALIVGFGPNEVNGFHALEALEAMVERRRGGESGVRTVTCLTGSAVWKAGDAGLWSWELVEAALRRSETVKLGDVRTNVASPAAFLLEHRDGLRSAVLMLEGHTQDFTFAGRLADADQAVSCLFLRPGPPGVKYFDCQVRHIETLLENRAAPVPLERTLLTSVVLDALMRSRAQGGQSMAVPDFQVGYAPSRESIFCRDRVALREVEM